MQSTRLCLPHLQRAKRNDDEGLSKMLYMGKMDVCESFRYKLTTNETTAEGKVALRAVTMATKSRKMKTLRGLSKEKVWYCTNHHWPTFSEVRH